MAIKPTDYTVNISKLASPAPDKWPAFWTKFQAHIEKDIDWRQPKYQYDRVGDAMRTYLRTIDADMIYDKKQNGNIVLKFKSEADFLIFKIMWS